MTLAVILNSKGKIPQLYQYVNPAPCSTESTFLEEPTSRISDRSDFLPFLNFRSSSVGGRVDMLNLFSLLEIPHNDIIPCDVYAGSRIHLLSCIEINVNDSTRFHSHNFPSIFDGLRYTYPFIRECVLGKRHIQQKCYNLFSEMTMKMKHQVKQQLNEIQNIEVVNEIHHSPTKTDSTVYEFVIRRFSKTIADRMAGVVSAMCAASPSFNVSLMSVAPLAFHYDKEYHSLLLAPFIRKLESIRGNDREFIKLSDENIDAHLDLKLKAGGRFFTLRGGREQLRTSLMRYLRRNSIRLDECSKLNMDNTKDMELFPEVDNFRGSSVYVMAPWEWPCTFSQKDEDKSHYSISNFRHVLCTHVKWRPCGRNVHQCGFSWRSLDEKCDK